MIQRIIVEEVIRHNHPSGDQRLAAYISMQKEMGTIKLWCRLDATDVRDIARLTLDPTLDTMAGAFGPFIVEVKQAGPTADMEKWATEGWEPRSPATRWYVEIRTPSTE